MTTAAINTDCTVNQAGQGSWHNTIKQGRQDFDQLFQSIQSGNMAGAQQAYAALDALRSGAPPAGDPSASAGLATGGRNAVSGISSDQAMHGQALQSGNVDSAKGALSALEQDAAAIAKSRHEQERQNAESVYALISSVQASAANGTPNLPGAGQAAVIQDDLNHIGQALQTRDTASAEKLLAKLEQDLLASARTQTQGYHSHHGTSGDQESGRGITGSVHAGASLSAIPAFMSIASAIHA